MIKANELRIGNWVQWDGIPVEWGHGHWLGIHDGNYSFPEPIPITPEILEKAGFSRYKDTECFGISYSNQGELLLFSGKTPIAKVNNIAKDKFYYSFNAIIHILSYVHQLQNLYFALTGKELNIEL